MKFAAIGPITTHFPARLETNDDLQRDNPTWNMKAIESKTGIYQRYIADENECSSDLAFAAAEKLFSQYDVDRSSIDYILLCTQSPDYPLPTTACLLQDRLGLRTDIGALDFNLGCSGFVYGLSLADGLIRTGSVNRVLLLTAETYSKFIHKTDRSLRTIFGDAAAATLVEASDEQSMTGFEFGTDGSGGDTLLVRSGGHRGPETALEPRNRKRWPSELYMDGPSLLSFTVGAVPPVVDSIVRKANLTRDDLDLYLMHQATEKLLSQLQIALKIDPEKMPINLRDVGNTVSATLPILIDQLREQKKLDKTLTNLMMGFGVGWSWAGCVWKDITEGKLLA